MLSCLVVLLGLTCTHGRNPAIQLTLTQKGLGHGADMVAGWMQERLEGCSLPEVTGGIDIGLGTVHYSFTRMSITQCDFPGLSVKFDEGQGLKTGVSSLNVAVRGSWKTKFGIIHDSGWFVLAVLNVEVASLVALNSDPRGRLSVSSRSCSAGVGAATIHFHGGTSWILQTFVDMFGGRLKSEIAGRICPGLRHYTGTLEEQLAAMEVSLRVGPSLVLELPLTSAPRVDASSLGLSFKGEFHSVQTHTDPPFQAQAFSLTPQDAYMLSLGVSEFSANSASYSYYSAGLFHANVNDSMIPEKCPLHLNTSFFSTLIPQLPKLFPGLLMELWISAREVPLFSFLPGEVQLGLPVTVTAFAIQPDSTRAPLFKLSTDAIFKGQVSIWNGRVRGAIALSNLTLALVSSEVGTFQTPALENLVKMGMKLMVLPKLNAKLREGFILPSMHHFQLVHPVLKVERGFIALFSDVAL